MEDIHMIHRLKSYRNGIHGDFFLSVAKRIENIPTPGSIKDIEWVGKCSNEDCFGTGVLHYSDGNNDEDIPSGATCPDCKGVGQITRPATLEECLDALPNLINLCIDYFKTAERIGLMVDEEQALTINNGRLRMREQKTTTETTKKFPLQKTPIS